MDIILCHLAADFDTLGAAVGASLLYPGSRIVLSGGSHGSVSDFLAIHRDAYPLLEWRAVDPNLIRRLILVDCHDPLRLGKAAAWLARPDVEIHLYDHHPLPEGRDLSTLLGKPPHLVCLEPVGSTCTLITEKLQAGGQGVSSVHVLALALGIHADTGSLTFGTSTARDAQALAWLMQQGIPMEALEHYLEEGLSPFLQDLLTQGLQKIPVKERSGYRLASWGLDLPSFTPGLAGLVMHWLDLLQLDVLIVVARQGERSSLIGRSRHEFAQLHTLMQPWGGGGHARAAAATLKPPPALPDPHQWAETLLQSILSRIPRPLTAADLMSAPVRTIRPETTVAEAARVLLRYGHSGLVVVNEQAEWVGVISRRDLDIALHHGFGHAPVKGYMTSQVKTIQPETTLPEIQNLMVKWDIGRLPVIAHGHLVGIVTRTDLLRHLHAIPSPLPPRFSPTAATSSETCPLALPLTRLSALHQKIVEQATQIADQMGIHLYLVGGAVRDLLLNRSTDDLDLVVDGPYPLLPGEAQLQGWGVKLGKALHQHFPETKLHIYGKFQTTTLLWPTGIEMDIASARTEFYPYPASPPEVTMGSIQQDLYRRDFSINALALQLNGERQGQLLDFFGGLEDLQQGVIRVLHANSFVEDPTRIYRAVRFATRLGFRVEPQTVGYLQLAITSGLHDAVGGDRLKQELAYILRSTHWPLALEQLAAWSALRCIHPDLGWSPETAKQVKRIGYWVYHFARHYPELGRQEIWQLRLEQWLSALPTASEIASRLHLPYSSIERLARLPELRKTALEMLTSTTPISQITAYLNGLSLEEVLFLAVNGQTPTRRLLWSYLQDWRRRKPLLNGHHLQQMGYRPGRHFETILNAVQKKALDGELTSLSDAEAYVQSHFPLSQLQSTQG